jgi:hypothetical protein
MVNVDLMDLIHHNTCLSTLDWFSSEWQVSLMASVTPSFKAKTRCSSYVCRGSSCHTYGQNVSTENQCIYYIVSYYKNLLQVQKGLNSGMDTILPRQMTRVFTCLEEVFIKQQSIAAIYRKYGKCEYIKYSASVGNKCMQACNKKGLTN